MLHIFSKNIGGHYLEENAKTANYVKNWWYGGWLLVNKIWY